MARFWIFKAELRRDYIYYTSLIYYLPRYKLKGDNEYWDYISFNNIGLSFVFNENCFSFLGDRSRGSMLTQFSLEYRGNEPFVCRANKDSRCDRYRCLPFRRFETYYLRQESSFRHKESVLAVPFDLLIPNCPRAEWFALWSFARINDATRALSRRRDVLDFRRFEARWKSAHRFCHQKSRLARVKQCCLNSIDI